MSVPFYKMVSTLPATTTGPALVEPPAVAPPRSVAPPPAAAAAMDGGGFIATDATAIPIEALQGDMGAPARTMAGPPSAGVGTGAAGASSISAFAQQQVSSVGAVLCCAVLCYLSVYFVHSYLVFNTVNSITRLDLLRVLGG